MIIYLKFKSSSAYKRTKWGAGESVVLTELTKFHLRYLKYRTVRISSGLQFKSKVSRSETPTSQARGLEQGNKQRQNLCQESKNNKKNPPKTRTNKASTQRGPSRGTHVKLEIPELDMRTRKFSRERDKE